MTGPEMRGGLIDAPFHVVADRMVELLTEMEEAL
jgi:hypothetical protein